MRPFAAWQTQDLRGECVRQPQAPLRRVERGHEHRDVSTPFDPFSNSPELTGATSHVPDKAEKHWGKHGARLLYRDADSALLYSYEGDVLLHNGAVYRVPPLLLVVPRFRYPKDF